MPDIDVKRYIDQLRRALPYVQPINARQLALLHSQRDYEGMVRQIRAAMNVQARLRIGWVNKGGPQNMQNAPAWVRLPERMPYYGTPEFKNTTIEIYVRKPFVDENSYAKVAIAIAHELSHVVLESIGHPLRKEEKAVDLTAMLLGFSQLYVVAAHTQRPITSETTKHESLGYLSATEIKIANRTMNSVAVRLKHALLHTFIGGNMLPAP